MELPRYDGHLSISGNAAATIQVANPDRAALVALFDSTGGKTWANNRNWLSNRPLREWHGVVTEDEYGRVHSLDLRENDLTGPIPPELGKLSSLVSLNLSDNALTGRIPRSFLDLGLRTLWIAGNNGLCVPSTTAFQAWVDGIPHFRGSFCGSGGSTGASADREWDATWEKVRLR